MGKNSKKKYPEYSGGSIQVNGRTVATANRKGNNINTNYQMSDAEKNIYDSIQSGMETSLGNLMTISDPQRQAWDKQLNAIKDRGISNIENILTPMETNLRNDVASRFGNLDNSVFMDNLNKITNKRAQAIAELSNTLESTQDSLYANELVNRINIITLLNNLNSAINNNMINFQQAAASNSQAGNDYNQRVYNAGINALGNTISTYAGLGGGLGSMASSLGNNWASAAGSGLTGLAKYLK